MMDKFSLEDLMYGLPSPLYVSCWRKDLAITEYLLQKLPPINIQAEGPDGISPLVILLQRNHDDLVIKYMDKFDPNKIAKLALGFNRPYLFQKATDSPHLKVSWSTIISWTVKAFNFDIIAGKEESFLTKLTKIFPLFNEATEQKFKLKLMKKFLNHGGQVFVNNILSYARDPFCPLTAANNLCICKISDLTLADCFHCPEEKHNG